MNRWWAPVCIKSVARRTMDTLELRVGTGLERSDLVWAKRRKRSTMWLGATQSIGCDDEDPAMTRSTVTGPRPECELCPEDLKACKALRAW